MSHIALTVIAHDEALNLPRMLDSVRKVVDGPKVALYIGPGKDATRELLQEDGFEIEDMPQGSTDPEWVNNCANEMLRIAKGKADFLLSMQPNTQLVMDSQPELEGLWHYVRYRQPNRPEPHRRQGDFMEWWLPNFIKGDEDWRYVGKEHAHLEPVWFDDISREEQAALIAQRKRLDCLHVVRTDNDGRRPEKNERVVQALEAEVEKEPDHPRNVFYLANTYRDLGRYHEAIQLYERRIFLGGWDEEVWYAEYQKGLCLAALGHHGDARLTLLSAFHRRPQRAEPLYKLCKMMLPPPTDVLFIEAEAYAPPQARAVNGD